MSHIDLFTKAPPPISEYKPGQLSEDQLKQFFEKGYVMVNNYFTKEDLLPVIRDLEWILDRVAKRLYKAGKIKDLHENTTFFKRAALLNNEFPGVGILLHKRDHMSKAIRELWSCNKLLNFNEQVLGSADILGHPVWNIRCKIPHWEEAVVPWHQDHGYFHGGAETLIPTAWIPLLDTNRANGCMEVVPKGHCSGKVATHTCCAGPTWYIDLAEDEMKTLGVDVKNAVLCEVPFGGVLFFNNLIPHRSVSNISNQVRWSLDLRWYKNGTDSCWDHKKKSIQMRDSKDPNLTIDWSSQVNKSMEKEYNGENVDEAIGVEDFDTVITGPWMSRWKLVSHNKHVEGFLAEQKMMKNEM